MNNHYTYLDKNLAQFLKNLKKIPNPLSFSFHGLITAHGDKCYGYESQWTSAGIPFNHGCMIYLLTYLSPWSSEVREVDGKFIKPVDWVMNNYKRFKPFIPKE